jgi:hypothetical protein
MDVIEDECKVPSVEYALDCLRRDEVAFAVIETMESHPVGHHWHPSCGFIELGCQIHQAVKL